MTKTQITQSIEIQTKLFFAKGGKVKQLPAGRASDFIRQAYARGIDQFHMRAFVRAAKGV